MAFPGWRGRSSRWPGRRVDRRAGAPGPAQAGHQRGGELGLDEQASVEEVARRLDGELSPAVLALMKAFVVAAALHHQVVLQQLGPGPQEAAGLLLHVPGGDDDVEHALRYTPHAVLEGCPTEEAVADVRSWLLAAADGDPDGRLLWHRVCTAALRGVEGAVYPGRGTSITMRDVLLGQGRRGQWERLGQVMGDDS